MQDLITLWDAEYKDYISTAEAKSIRFFAQSYIALIIRSELPKAKSRIKTVEEKCSRRDASLPLCPLPSLILQTLSPLLRRSNGGRGRERRETYLPGGVYGSAGGHCRAKQRF